MNIEHTYPEAREAGVEYRSISTLALVAVGLGVTSGTALAHPLMWWLPLVTILVAVAAYRRISSSNGALLGKSAAVLAICLALFFLSFAVVRLCVGRSLEASFASRAAESWFEILQHGDLHRAHQWTLSGYQREREGTVLADYYRNDSEAKAAFERFRDETLAHALPALGSDDRFEYQRPVEFLGRRNRRVMRLLFHRFKPGSDTPSPVIVAVERRYDRDYDVTFWRIANVECDHD